jgi:hypothetical protein
MKLSDNHCESCTCNFRYGCDFCSKEYPPGSTAGFLSIKYATKNNKIKNSYHWFCSQECQKSYEDRNS